MYYHEQVNVSFDEYFFERPKRRVAIQESYLTV